MGIRILLLLLLSASLASCSGPQGADPENKGNIRHDTLFPASQEFQMLATLYTQQAAEYRALCHQSFNLARIALQAEIESADAGKPLAVVLDIDETVLDNSPYQALCIARGISYPECWDDWCLLADAEPVPGVRAFLDFARSAGVDIFFITNRKAHLREATTRNLRARGLGDPDTTHLLMRTTEGSKESRREQVLRGHHIALFVGDNLADFATIFETKDTDRRKAMTDSLAAAFGERFIILPNTMYGDWLTALYSGGDQAGPDAERLMRFGALRPAPCGVE